MGSICRRNKWHQRFRIHKNGSVFNQAKISNWSVIALEASALRSKNELKWIEIVYVHAINKSEIIKNYLKDNGFRSHLSQLVARRRLNVKTWNVRVNIRCVGEILDDLRSLAP